MTVFKDKKNLYNMYKIKLHKTLKFLWLAFIDVCCELNGLFSDVFVNHFPRIHWSVLRKIANPLYLWDIFDVNLWEKFAITVKLCYIETRLKQGYDLIGYLLKKKQHVLTITRF